MPPLDDDVEEKPPVELDEEAQADADFLAGAKEDKAPTVRTGAAPKPEVKAEEPKTEQETPAEPEPPKPEYVQLTKEQFDRLEAAANRTLTLEQQMNKSFGTFGNTLAGVQRVINDLQAATPRGLKVEIPEDAFAGIKRDFGPELAGHIHDGLKATLSGITGTGPATAEIDPDKLRQLVGEHAARERARAEVEALDEAVPDWRVIVGQVDTSVQAPDPNNPFRKWLATKDAAYQTRINRANTAAVISRAIELFQQETAPAPKPTPKPNLQAQLRQSRIAEAVKPRGDRGPASPARNDDDEFLAGYASG